MAVYGADCGAVGIAVLLTIWLLIVVLVIVRVDDYGVDCGVAHYMLWLFMVLLIMVLIVVLPIVMLNDYCAVDCCTDCPGAVVLRKQT